MKNFMMDERGATAIEYGLISALICVAVIAAIAQLGQTISGQFYNQIAGALGGS